MCWRRLLIKKTLFTSRYTDGATLKRTGSKGCTKKFSAHRSATKSDVSVEDGFLRRSSDAFFCDFLQASTVLRSSKLPNVNNVKRYLATSVEFECY